jgi:hypothetical protein
MRETNNRDIEMPWRHESLQRNEPPTKRDFLKRRTFEEGRAQVDAAHIVTHRLYCDALGFWRRCAKRPCKRHRRCAGEPTGCLLRGPPAVPQAQRLKAQKEVITGGPRGHRAGDAYRMVRAPDRACDPGVVGIRMRMILPPRCPRIFAGTLSGLRRVGVWPGFCFKSRNGLESHATHRSTL